MNRKIPLLSFLLPLLLLFGASQVFGQSIGISAVRDDGVPITPFPPDRVLTVETGSSVAVDINYNWNQSAGTTIILNQAGVQVGSASIGANSSSPPPVTITFQANQAGSLTIDAFFEDEPTIASSFTLQVEGVTFNNPLPDEVIPADSRLFLDASGFSAGAFDRHFFFYSRGIPRIVTEGVPYSVGDKFLSPDRERLYLVLAGGSLNFGSIAANAPALSQTDPTIVETIDGVQFRYAGPDLADDTPYLEGDRVVSNGNVFVVGNGAGGSLDTGQAAAGLPPAVFTGDISTLQTLATGIFVADGEFIEFEGRVYLASFPVPGPPIEIVDPAPSLTSEDWTVTETIDGIDFRFAPFQSETFFLDGSVGFTLLATPANLVQGLAVSSGDYVLSEGRVYVAESAGTITSTAPVLTSTNPNIDQTLDGVDFRFVFVFPIRDQVYFWLDDIVSSNGSLYTVTRAGQIPDGGVQGGLDDSIPTEQLLPGEVGFNYAGSAPVGGLTFDPNAPWQAHKYREMGEDNSSPYAVVWGPNLSIDNPFSWYGQNGYLASNTRVQLLGRLIDSRFDGLLSSPRSVVVAPEIDPQAVLQVQIDSPTDGRTVAASTTLRLSAQAQDVNQQVRLVQSVQFYIDGVRFGAPDLAFPYNPIDPQNGGVQDWTPSVAGTYLIHALATDDKGNRFISDAITVNVTDNAPEVRIEAPVGTLADPLVISSDQNLIISAYAAGSGGSVAAINNVGFYSDGNLIAGGSQISGTGFWTGSFIVGDVFAPGEVYTINARATDNNSLTVSSDPVYIEVLERPANSAPTVDLLTIPTPITVGSDLQITAIAQDLDGSVAEVSFFANGNLVGTVSSPSSGNQFTTTWSPSATGAFVLTAVATDNLGSQSTSTGQTITINPVVGLAPTVTPRSLPGGTFNRYAQGSSILLAATAQDPDGTIEEVVIQVGGTTVATLTEPPFQVRYVLSNEGNFVVSATARDNDGNISAGTIIVESLDAGLPIPQVEIISPTPGTAVQPLGSIAVEVDADDQGGTTIFGGAVPFNVEFLADDEQFGALTAEPHVATYTAGDETGTVTLRSIAYYTQGITFTLPDGTVIGPFDYAASRVSDPVDLSITDPVSVTGFGDILPRGGWAYDSTPFGLLVFPGGNINGGWAYSYDLDTWLGVVSADRVWSAEFGFLSPTSSATAKSLESSIYGTMTFGDRQASDRAIWVNTENLQYIGKFIGTPFFWSVTLNGYIGGSGGSLYSFTWGWIQPVSPYVVISPTLGRLFLSDDPAMQGAVWQERTRRLLYP